MTITLTEVYRAHVIELERLALNGDEFAARSLACLSLAITGWRIGDPDPSEGE